MTTLNHYLLNMSAFFLLLIAGQVVKAQDYEVDVVHWWVSKGENAAVDVLRRGMAAQDGGWTDSTDLNPDLARTAGIRRIYNGEPPTAMQLNTGKQFGDLVANGLLQDLDKVAAEQAWDTFLPPFILNAVTVDGQYFAAPMNIHGDNWFWINKPLLDKAGIEMPTTYDDLIKAAPVLREQGIIPLAVGSQPWQRRIIFNSVLLAEAGAGTYLAVLGDHDTETIRGDAFLKAAEVFKTLRDLGSDDEAIIAWSDAFKLVVDGKAALQITGDWAKGEYAQLGLMPGVDYECIVPNSENGYIMGGDVFVFPKQADPADRDNQRKLASLVMQPATQLAFNREKGSLPVRTDVDVSSLDLCAQRAADIMRDETKQIPSGPYLMPEELNGAIDDVISEFWDAPSMSAAEFVEAYIETVDYFRQ